MPDVQFLFNAAPLAASPYLAPFTQAYEDGFAARIVGLRPESRGMITLSHTDPCAPPRITQNFFAHDKDLITIRKGIKLAHEVAQQSPIRAFIDKELTLAHNSSDQAIDDYIRTTAITVHHPLGTCRMGRDDEPDAVVTSDLSLIGAEGLRIVDASVMPDLIGGNINAAVMMIAERASDLIVQNA
jgi:4-pyridoxate dehydrogenase